MKTNLKKIAFDFLGSGKINQHSKFYCQTRDIFQARLDKMMYYLLFLKSLKEDDVYIISAIAGEIGNNSFDHNLGSWVGEAGVFFGYSLENDKLKIFLVDAGQGIFKTLKKVKPEVKDDQEALKVAFNERISGRAPESRGNGLKFVRANIKDREMHLIFISGKAKIELNDIEKIEKIRKDYQGCLAVITINLK